MGRLAGPLGPKWRAADDARRKMWEDHRCHLASITPVVHLPAATALLGRATISEADKHDIEMTTKTGVIR